MVGSSYVDDDVKYKRDGRNKSASWTDRPPGVTNIFQTDGPSDKVDDWKSKMDEFNSNPHSERITNNVKELSTKRTDHLKGVIIYSPRSGRIIKMGNMITSPQSGQIINKI